MPDVNAPEDLARCDVLGTRVSASTFEEAVAALETCVAERRSSTFSAANVFSIMLGVDDPAFRACVNDSTYVMADGMPLVWVARRSGFTSERVHGDDLLLAATARHPEWRHFFLGGAPGQPELVARALQQRIPGLQVAGTRATPVRPLPLPENLDVLESIRRSAADVVWVGMGTPAQDIWMAANRDALGRPLVGVGSAFDLLSGRTRPTPSWMRRSGLQWLHRLVQEPRRLARRYLVHNVRFVLAMSARAVRRQRVP